MSRLRSENGVALMMVLWTIVILSFLLLSLSEDIQLESFLTRNLMDQIQVQFIAQAGVARGIAALTGDQTLADGFGEEWLMPIQAQIESRGSFTVKIEDIGSKININYVGDPVLPAILADSSREFADWRLDKVPFYLMQELEAFEDGSFTGLADNLTFNGKFNLNTDDYAILKQIMLKKRISEWTADQIIQDLNNVEKPIQSLDDLLLRVPSLDLSTFAALRDEVDVRGNININLVDEETLVILGRSFNIPQDQLTAITTMREKEVMYGLDVLAPLIGDENVKRISPYFDVTSKYFRITSVAQSATSSIEKKIIVEVERIPEKVAQGRVLEWRTQILSWVECSEVGENMRRRNNIFASIDLNAEEIKLLIVQKGMKGVKTLCSETYPRRELSLAGQKLQEHQPKEVILILPQERVIVRDMTVPPVDMSRIRSMLFFELAGALPYAMEQVELDFLLLQRSKKNYELKVFIIPEHMNREVENLKEAGILVDRVIPRGLAITGYCKEKGIVGRPVKMPLQGGQLVVYPDYKKYFCRHFESDIDSARLTQLFTDEGIEPLRWDAMELSEPGVDLGGAIHFATRYPKFNLIHLAAQASPYNLTKVGIGLVLVAILAVNSGSFYLNYKMKAAELAAYQEELKVILPQADLAKVKKTKLGELKTNYEKLKQVSAKDTDYLIWLSELHNLLAEDTEINILVFEGDQLKEMHGRAPMATSVSDRLADSPYFANPEFTAPITPKEDEDGQVFEEFSISAQLVNPDRKGDGSNE